MNIRLFDIVNGKPVPSEHSYTLTFLTNIRDNFPESEWAPIYSYLFYMTCPDSDINPAFNLSDIEKEEWIRREVGGDFWIDDHQIQYALERCQELYETPTKRVYDAMKSILDKMARYLQDAEIMPGRDGNGDYIVKLMEKYPAMSRSFKEAYKDMKDEFGTRGRGGRETAYDEDDD